MKSLTNAPQSVNRANSPNLTYTHRKSSAKSVALTRLDRYYGSAENGRKAKHLDDRFSRLENDKRIPVIASVLLKIEALPGGWDFTNMPPDKLLATVKENDSFFHADFNELFDWLITLTFNGEKKLALEFLEGNINKADPVPTDFREKIVLHPKSPIPAADAFIKHCFTRDGEPTLRYYADEFYIWEHNVYVPISAGTIESRLTEFLETAYTEKINDEGEIVGTVPYPVRHHNICEIMSMVKRRRHVPSERLSPPCWIGKDDSPIDDASLVMFGKTRNLYISKVSKYADKIIKPSPNWFNLNCLPFDYDQGAHCPNWEQFLKDLFGKDREAIETLMEFIGLCLTPITRFQKALFLCGDKRTGKGTIAEVMTNLIGSHNVTNPTTDAVSESFGLQSFIGRQLAIFTDMRFDRKNSAKFSEKILQITGEDRMTINRKNRDAYTTKLTTRIMFISNEIPEILDSGNALASRFIFMPRLKNSFYGKEDTGLREKLLSELPGIMNLALCHLHKLLERGRFRQPESGENIAAIMGDLSNPINEFVREHTEPLMTKKALWERYREFCEGGGIRPIAQHRFLNRIVSAGYDCDFDAASILEKIRNVGNEATAREIRVITRRFKKNPQELEKKLNKMKADGILESCLTQDKYGGRPVEIFKIVKADADNEF